MRTRFAASVAAVVAAVMLFDLTGIVEAQSGRCYLGGHLYNRNRQIARDGVIEAECPSRIPPPVGWTIHSAPFGNWGVHSLFGARETRGSSLAGLGTAISCNGTHAPCTRSSEHPTQTTITGSPVSGGGKKPCWAKSASTPSGSIAGDAANPVGPDGTDKYSYSPTSRCNSTSWTHGAETPVPLRCGTARFESDSAAAALGSARAIPPGCSSDR